MFNIGVHEEKLGNTFKEPRKTGSHPGWGPLTLAVSALPPDSQPSQFSISLCMCRQNPAIHVYQCPILHHCMCSHGDASCTHGQYILLHCSVSHTTRPQGPKESHGRDYYFIDEGTFDRAVKSVRIQLHTPTHSHG